MDLTYKNYIAYSEGDRFNLYEKVMAIAKSDTKNHKKGDKYETEVLIGYGYKYENLVRRIATEELHKDNVIIPLGDYVTLFNDVLKQIKL